MHLNDAHGFAFLLEKKLVTLLSFVIPCYRSEKTIEKVVDEIINTVSEREDYDYEIILVNDFSPDHVYSVIERMASNNKKIKCINLSKNMGKHSAVMAGYKFVKGEYVVDLDDDCQCPVYELWKLLEPVERDECDYAVASYYEKKESLFKRLGSEVNALMARIMLERPKELRFNNFGVMKAFVCKEIIKYKNPYPYLEGLILRVTSRVNMVRMEERDRGDDNGSGFTLKKSLHLIFNGLTAFSIKPLRIASFCGMMFAVVGFIYGIYSVVHKLINPMVAVGYSSIVSILLFSLGLIMVMLGIIGEYVGRIYISINDSPQYVIKSTINIE